MSTPIWCSQPPGAQKSFCISTTMHALRRRSMQTRCGSAATPATSGGNARRTRSASSSETCQALRSLAPSAIFVIPFLPTAMRPSRKGHARGLGERAALACPLQTYHGRRGACMVKLPARLWQEMTTTDFAALDPERTIAVLPVAAIEQHGPHLPVSVDACINQGILDEVLRRLPDDLP